MLMPLSKKRVEPGMRREDKKTSASADPMLLYYNAIVGGATPGSGSVPQELNYNETRTEPIVSCASNYEMSAVRFSMPLASIPIMIVPVKLDQKDPNVLDYSVTVVDSKGAAHQRNLVWVPENDDVLAPPAGPYTGLGRLGVRSQFAEYYSLRTYQALITSLNVALETALAAAGVADRAFFVIQPDKGNLISFLAEPAFDPDDAKFNDTDIYLGRSTYDALLQSSMPSFEVNDTAGRGQLLTVANYSVNRFIEPATATLFYVMTQSHNTLPLWHECVSILFQTGIPVVQECIPTIGAGGVVNQSSTGAKASILTDFIIQSGEDATPTRCQAVYLPTAQYRYMQLASDNPLYSFSVRASWVDVYGIPRPVLVPPGRVATIKFQFRRLGAS